MNMDLKFNSIKSYSKSYNPSDERKLVEIYNQNFDGFDIGCAKAYELQSLCKKHKENGFQLIPCNLLI